MAMGLQKKTVMLAGTPFFGAVGVNSFKDIGNTTKATIAHSFKEATIPNGQGGGGNDDKMIRVESIKVSLSVRRASVELLAIALGGTVADIAAGAVTDEAHTVVNPGELIMFNQLQDLGQALTVMPDGGGAALVEGTDYIRKRSGIIPIVGGALAASDEFTVDYTKTPHLRIQALLNTATERAFLFDGYNEKDNKPWVEKLHRVAWSPAANLELVGGGEFASFDIEGEALAWEGITDPTKSPFYEMLVGTLF